MRENRSKKRGDAVGAPPPADAASSRQDRERPDASDAEAAGRIRIIESNPSYLRADLDTGLLARDELRPVRLQLELLKPELLLSEQGVKSTIVVFGGTRIVEPAVALVQVEKARRALHASPKDPELRRRLAVAERILAKSHYYDMARELARLVSERCQHNTDCEFVVTTGGGPGIMEAANRGAFDAGAKSIGMNITLPMEQHPNPYITPDLCFQFRYFALRKMHFLQRARALVAFPGGYGTLDEIFDALCLLQTGKLAALPVVLVGEAFWRRVFDAEFLVDEGVIDADDVGLFSYAETATEVWERIAEFWHAAGEDIVPA